MKLPIILLACLPAIATDITVCASGCDRSNFQDALNDAAASCAVDTITLTAPEVFEGSFKPPFRQCTGIVKIRTSAHASLPKPGTRVVAADAALMPKLQASNTSDPVLSFGYDEKSVSSVDTSTDTMTFTGSHGFVDTNPIACWNDDGTIPIVENQVYYVRDATSNTVKLALYAGGPVVDLATTPTATRFRCTLSRSIRGWTIQGIEIRSKPGQASLFNLLQVGTGSTTARAGFVADITVDRSYIHGNPGINGPRNCILTDSGSLTIVDSRIEQCKYPGNESHAIVMASTPGPVLVRNTYLDAASINILLGGDYIRVEGLVPGDNGGMVFEGNHFTKDIGEYKYSAGTGGASDPAGACSENAKYLNTTSGNAFLCALATLTWSTPISSCVNGEYFRRTDVTQDCPSGACWSCDSGVFIPSVVYRSSGYLVKNLFEIKSGINIYLSGNVFENNWIDSQTGPAIWLVSQNQGNNTDAFARGENIRFQHNIVRNSAQGIRIASTNNPLLLQHNSRVLLYDNLVYKIGATDYPSIDTASARPLSFAGPCDDCTIDHNTVVSGVALGQGIYFDTAAFTRPRLSNTVMDANFYGLIGDGSPVSTYFGTGNILNSVAVDNVGTKSAPASFGAYATNGEYITTGTTLFVGGGDYRLDPTSPYSAHCASSCDFTGTDTKDLGADIDAVDSATQGAIAGTPWLGGSLRVDLGSTRAIVRYTAPSASTCTLKLYTDIARTTLSGDTDSGPEQADDRAGNVTNGVYRQFVLGTNTALTANAPYWAVVTCGASIGLASFQTLPAGAGTYQSTFQYSTARTGEYANNTAFTGATPIASSVEHKVVIPPGDVIYYRYTGGPTVAVVAR